MSARTPGPNTGQRSPETDANAAFIVEACNAHDGLRESFSLAMETIQKANADVDSYAEQWRAAQKETDTLRAENERLREALELIAGKGWSSLCVEHAAEEMHAMAVTALGKAVE